jgi:hypothetical protein
LAPPSEAGLTGHLPANIQVQGYQEDIYGFWTSLTSLQTIGKICSETHSLMIKKCKNNKSPQALLNRLGSLNGYHLCGVAGN